MTAASVVGPRRGWRAIADDRLATAIVLAAAFVFLVVGARHMWFFGDDWAFIVGRRQLWSGGRYAEYLLAPHNEHWSTVPVIAHGAIFKLFGLHHYMAYVVPVIVCHLLSCLLLRVLLLRAGVDRWLSVGLVAVFAIFGSGAENLVWGFQLGFVGAVTLGLAQIVLADRDGPMARTDVLGGALGVVAVMTAGIAVTMIAAVGVLLVIRRRWLAILPQVGAPAAVYLAWYFGYGRSRIQSPTADLSLLPEYVATGVTNAFDQLVQVSGLGIVAAAAVVISIAMSSRSVRSRFAAPLAMAAGAVLLFAVNGTGRATFGIEQATASRYVYIAGALLLPAAGVGLALLRARGRGASILAWALVAWAILGNVGDYYRVRQFRMDLLAVTRPAIEAAARTAGDPRTDPEARPEPTYDPDLTMAALAELVASGSLALTQP